MQTFKFTLPQGGSYNTLMATTSTGETEITITINEGSKLEEVLRRTIACGMMTADGQWAEGVSKKQIAIWVSLTSAYIDSPTRWQWAEKRWGLKGLGVTHDKALNYPNYRDIEKEIQKHCFGM